MAKIAATSVDAYIDAQPETARRVLTRVRRAIRAAMPGGEETISYKIPTYRLHGRIVIYFAGWKHHYSLYPIDARTVAACDEGGAVYEIEKSTVRFPLSEPVPTKLIGKMVKLRAKALGGAIARSPARRR
jgi:uncharacterized protein YdhG (YjbR/CyaY superfamily)